MVIKILNGLTLAMLLFLVASGLTIIMSTLRKINFAHGSIFMLGSYLTIEVMQWLPPNFKSFFLGLLGAVLIVGGVGVLIEKSIYFLGEREKVYEILLTYSFVLIIYDSVHILFGAGGKFIETPRYLEGGSYIFGAFSPNVGLFIIILGFLVAIGLWLFLYKTRVGLMARCISYDEEIARTLGINTKQIFTLIFALGCGITAMGGGVSGMWIPVTPYMWELTLLQAFCIVIIGGIGSILGAFIASVMVGLLISFLLALESRLTMVLIFLITVVILKVRPSGFLGRETL